jgi:outer membrane protein
MIPSPRALVGAACLALMSGMPVQAQTLQELYEAARTYDAAYLAARAQAQSAEFRAAQAEALTKPSASLSASATTSLADAPRIGTGDTNGLGATLSGRYPLFNRANQATIAQARKSLVAAQADLESAEQDLIVRLSQAYFDVLAAQDALGASRANKTARVSLGGRLPRPTSTKKPTIPRTIWWQKAFARISNTTSPPSTADHFAENK